MSAPTVRPSAPAARAAAAVRHASAVLARLRRARLFHPDGRSFTGQVTIWGTPGPPTGVALLDQPGRYAATIRFSKGLSTPGSWPDVLGLAVRLHAAGPFDLLVGSSAAPPLLRAMSLPRRRFAGTYSTVTPLRTARRRVWLGLLADPESPDLGRSLAQVAAAARTGEPRLVLAVASAVGPWRPLGEVSVGDQLSARQDAALAFDPIGNVPAGLWATGPLAWLRDQTYRGSRAARGASAQSGGSLGVTV
ncbi:phosphodiesterase [Micromonospora costi]|uniref:phosphodiesterase n=1 Tax=Micromonospora costi TaxID=1530042 RepID=UPI0033DD0DD3